MTLFDRFRASAASTHPDPAVRLAEVERLPITAREALGALASGDEDARVRRAAVAKLLDPAVLASVAAADQDAGVQAAAIGMLRDVALEAFEEAGEAEALQAVAQLEDRRTLAQVARESTRDAVAMAALQRVDDPSLLSGVARQGTLEAVRLQAFEHVREAGREALLAVAMQSEFKDTALAALAELTDRADLEAVAIRGRNKSASKRARTIMREDDERAARAAQDAALQAAADAAAARAAAEAARRAATATLTSGAAPLVSAGTDGAVAATPTESTDVEALQVDAVAVAAAAEAEAARRARVAEVLADAAAAVALPALDDARARLQQVRRAWQPLAAGVDDALRAAFATHEAQLAARDAEARDAEARSRREALARLQQLIARAEPLAADASLTLRVAERALRDVQAALAQVPALPTPQDADAVQRALSAIQDALAPRTLALREADDWRRFANVAVQEQLCVAMEALKTAEDLDAVVRSVRDLQTQWRAAADVPRAHAETLWKRFKAAHDEVWARCEAHFTAQQALRAEHLARKLALCERAEALSASTDWVATAEALKVLQAEWKTIGAVSRGREKAVWDRFRTACDAFFTRRQADLTARKSVWTENQARKDALCEQAESLALSTDWETTAATLRRLQAEWKTIGPVKKSKAEATWLRFRTACDTFFTRFGQRHDLARDARVAARVAICAELEQLLAAAPEAEAPDGLLATARDIRARWQRELDARGVPPAQAQELDQRFAVALGSVVTRWPAAFGGSDLDPEANRRALESLVQKVEGLATSLTTASQPSAVDETLSPSSRLATMLRDALASNTIGGKGEDGSRLRAAAEELRGWRESFARLGPIPSEVRAPLVERFHKAARTVAERTAHAQAESPARDGARDRGPRRDNGHGSRPRGGRDGADRRPARAGRDER